MQKHTKARVGNRALRAGEPLEGVASWIALERSTSGFAVMRERRLVVANPQWHALARGPWRVRSAHGTHVYRELETAAIEELSRRRRGGARAALLTAERPDGPAVLRLRVERLAGSGEVLVLACDISEEDAHERELAAIREGLAARDRMAALGRLAAGVNHDVGNTLNALALQLQAAARRKPGAPLDRHLLEMAHAVETMRATIARLGQLGGARRHLLGPIDLAAAIAAAAELVRYELAARKGRSAIALELRVPPELPRVVGDANDVTHVFVNLLLNARDAMRGGGAIRVVASVRRGEVLVRVEDEGKGIGREHLSRIFDPFFTTKGAVGSGLGLSIVQATMRALGGSVAAANRRRGGAVFTLRFPVAIRARKRSRRQRPDGG